MNSRRSIRFFVCLLVCVGCWACNRSATTEKATAQDSLPAPTFNFPEITTAVSVMPLKNLPSGYFLDSVSVLDSILFHHSTLYFPQAAHDEKLNAMIRAFCDLQVAKSLPDIPQDTMQNSVFELWLTDMQQYSQLLSMQFQDQSYYAGAAHYTHRFDCLNIDLETHSELFFDKLLQFSRGHSKQDFCDFVNAQNTDSQIELHPDQLDATLKYAIADDTLCLKFDDFEMGPSWTTAFVAMADLQDYWTPHAIQILDLKRP
jgi:hypothetical protein